MSRAGDAIGRLPRTLLASLASAEAEKAARSGCEGEGGNSPAWLLSGVVWQRCRDCRNLNYPARPLCSNCLSDQVDWQQCSSSGYLLSLTNLHVSFDDLYLQKGPWKIGLIAHIDGPNVFAFLDDGINKHGEKIELFTAPDAVGQAVFIAVKPDGEAGTRAAKLATGLAALADG